MTKQGDDEETTPESAPGAPTGGSSQTPASSTPVGSEGPKGYVTEESYKGLQRAAERQKAKLEQELADQKRRLDELSQQLGEATLALNSKAKVEEEMSKLSTSQQALQAERDALARKLNQQAIILAEFPDLAPLAAFIPPADTDDAFKVNAQQFKAALLQFSGKQTAQTMAGAVPPIRGGNEIASGPNIDELWNEVDRYAGVPGKEREFEKANAELQKALQGTN